MDMTTAATETYKHIKRYTEGQYNHHLFTYGDNANPEIIKIKDLVLKCQHGDEIKNVWTFEVMKQILKYIEECNFDDHNIDYMSDYDFIEPIIERINTLSHKEIFEWYGADESRLKYPQETLADEILSENYKHWEPLPLESAFSYGIDRRIEYMYDFICDYLLEAIKNDE